MVELRKADEAAVLAGPPAPHQGRGWGGPSGGPAGQAASSAWDAVQVRGGDRGLCAARRFDVDSCTYHFRWDSRAACAVKPQEVHMVNGTFTNPASGQSFSLGDIYFK